MPEAPSRKAGPEALCRVESEVVVVVGSGKRCGAPQGRCGGRVSALLPRTLTSRFTVSGRFIPVSSRFGVWVGESSPAPRVWVLQYCGPVSALGCREQVPPGFRRKSRAV